jgi:hypothetical protein
MGARRGALTFDDGPDPVWTPAVLESLAEHRLRATFFVIGSRADLGEAGKHAHADPEPVGLAWRSNSRRTCSVVGGRTPAAAPAWHRRNAASPRQCGTGSPLATIAPAASTRAAVSAPSTRLPVLVLCGSPRALAVLCRDCPCGTIAALWFAFDGAAASTRQGSSRRRQPLLRPGRQPITLPLLTASLTAGPVPRAHGGDDRGPTGRAQSRHCDGAPPGGRTIKAIAGTQAAEHSRVDDGRSPPPVPPTLAFTR